jgi:hypothetical protein
MQWAVATQTIYVFDDEWITEVEYESGPDLYDGYEPMLVDASLDIDEVSVFVRERE